MERYSMREARDYLPTIVNEGLVVEVDNRKNVSVVLPKSKWQAIQQQLQEQEKEIVQMEMDQVLHRNDAPLSHDEVKSRLMEKIRDKLGT